MDLENALPKNIQTVIPATASRSSDSYLYQLSNLFHTIFEILIAGE